MKSYRSKSELHKHVLRGSLSNLVHLTLHAHATVPYFDTFIFQSKNRLKTTFEFISHPSFSMYVSQKSGVKTQKSLCI